MDGRGGCCIARYAGGVPRSYGMSKVERIMLKFRPIAPKPMAAGSASSGSTMENSDGYGGARRPKRKYVRANGNKKKEKSTDSKRRKASASSPSVSGGGDVVVTLSLMPETPDRKEGSPTRSSPSENSDLTLSVPAIKPDKLAPIWLSFNNNQQKARDGHLVSVADHSVVMQSPPPPPRRPQAVSFVTVECVTDTWIDGDGLGFSDEARVMMQMERDTCPAFITDGRDTVVWTNKAYREMSGGGGGSDGETLVVLVKKDNQVAVPVSYSAFTCTVRVTWETQRPPSPSTLTAPCDAWRLRNGGFAWRLDVKAALCLGL